MSIADKFREFTSKNYADQGKAFLNAYWEEHSDTKEDVWKYWNKFVELDQAKGKEGSDVDEFTAHRFLEAFGETKTVKEMREALSEADLDFNKRLALIEFLLWKNNRKIEEFVKRPQAASEEIKKCQAALDRVLAALEDARAKAQVSEQKTKEARDAESKFKKADEELKAALAELKAQEDAYENKKATLKKKSEEGGVVSRNKAANELAQLLAEDPLPLSRAKITTEAASKKAEKAREPFKAATEEAEAAEQAAKDAVEEVKKQVKEAEDALEEIKKHSSAGQGNIWWVERELAEAKKYMPKSKGGTW